VILQAWTATPAIRFITDLAVFPRFLAFLVFDPSQFFYSLFLLAFVFYGSFFGGLLRRLLFE
jgi:hypothetical protein